MPKYINNDLIKIERSTITILKEHCKDFKLNQKDMFLYLNKNNLYVGFSQDKKLHIKLEDKNWIPYHTC